MLPRKMRCDPLWSKVFKEPFDKRSAFIEFVMEAYFVDSFKEINGKSIPIKRGQFLTTRRELMQIWGWNDVKKVDRLLSSLERMGLITHKGTPDGILITIENYDDFQGDGDTKWDNQQDNQWDNQRPNQRDTLYNKSNNPNKGNKYKSHPKPEEKELIPPDDWNG